MAERVEGSAGDGISRRRFGAGALALGGALVIATPPGAAWGAAASGMEGTGEAGQGGGDRRTTLRRGSAHRAGLLEHHLGQVTAEAETYLHPSPKHPYYPGAVLLAGRGGTVALEEALGKAVRYARYDEKNDTGVEFPAGRQRPMTMDTVFDLASLSKLFTSVLAVQHIERGELALEAAVASYLPEFAAAGKQAITIRQLLTHTSGFQPDLPFYDRPTREQRLRLLWDEAPRHTPGTAYLYSDLNLISLQLVLERISGRPLDELVRTGITGPLGMASTRYNPPASWKPRIAATEDQRKPWARLDRGLVWGEVHDENAFAFGGVAGHAGVFSCAWDLAVLCRTLLNGGAYGRVRVLRPESVRLMFTNFNTAFPGDDHGLGFELYQHWYMGAMATPSTAGHTGFTGTSVVLDPTTDSFLVLLSNSVHPCRTWRSGSAPRVATGDALARAVPVRPRAGRTAWFSGMASAADATLALPALPLASRRARLSCDLWWDVEPSDALRLEVSTDDGATWQPAPFTTRPPHGRPTDHPDATATGYNGRVWQRAHADLAAWRGHRAVRLRWRYTTDQRYVGRGVYVEGLRVTDGAGASFDERRPRDAARVEAKGWTRSSD
ncbi:serine hydrolase [Streptomyces sp. NPDC050617]|uniref:serine hydrolase n=1 Tax=Streptomyces sp. NPDC050617 TaxID=3154628 RepID=UPI003435BE76